MNLKKLILTENACYKAGKTIVPKGIMVHSTGANNPYLKRYVGPDDGLLGKNQYNNHWNQDKPDGLKVCVHAFIGKLNDGTIASYQTLPWNHRGWHAGGIANDTHIGIEICEDDLNDPVYFNAVYQEGVELSVHLCRLFNLTEKDIISHYEGYQRGIASNHRDPIHWFSKHGQSMESLREAVKKALNIAALKDKEELEEGDIVEIKPSARTYYPGGPSIPSWVKMNYHLITQDKANNKPVIKGGKECVLLGKTILKSSMDEKPGIMTWVDKDILELVSAGVEVEPELKPISKYYRVQVGAFSKKENAEALLKKLKAAGFDGFIKYD